MFMGSLYKIDTVNLYSKTSCLQFENDSYLNNITICFSCKLDIEGYTGDEATFIFEGDFVT